MILQENEGNTESLDKIFLKFAKVLLMKMEEWTASEQVPVTLDTNTIFYEDAVPDEPESKYVTWHQFPPEERKDYFFLLFGTAKDPVWTSEEAQACIRRWMPYRFLCNGVK